MCRRKHNNGMSYVVSGINPILCSLLIYSVSHIPYQVILGLVYVVRLMYKRERRLNRIFNREHKERAAWLCSQNGNREQGAGKSAYT